MTIQFVIGLDVGYATSSTCVSILDIFSNTIIYSKLIYDYRNLPVRSRTSLGRKEMSKAIHNNLEEIINNFDCFNNFIVCLERAFVYKNIKTALTIERTVGMVESICYINTIEFLSFSTIYVKKSVEKYITKDINKKEATGIWLKNKIKNKEVLIDKEVEIDYTNQDIVDSIAICIIGAKRLSDL